VQPTTDVATATASRSPSAADCVRDEGASSSKSAAQRVALNTVVMLVKQLVMAVLGVLFVGYLARRVGVAAWGELQASLAIASVVTVVAGIGVRGYLAREVAVRPDLGPRHLGSALMIRGVTGTALLGATIVVFLVFRPRVGAVLVTLASASQLATLLYSTMWLSFEAHERFQYIFYVELAARLFVIGAASALLAIGYGVMAAATVLMVGNVVELALTYYFVSTRLYRPRFQATRRELWSIARASLPIGALGAIATALQQSDKVMLRALVDETAVGIYSAAWVLSDNFVLIADLFLGAAFAAGMRLYASDRQAFGRLYQSSMTVAAVLGMPIAAGVFLLSPEIITFVYGPRGYAGSATVLRILVCQLPITFAYQVGTLPLLAAKRELAMVKVLALALTANVVLNFVLVPRYQAVGSAVATLVVAVATLAISLHLTRGWTRLVHLRRIGATMAATALMTGAAYVALRSFGMWTAVVVGALSYVPLLLALHAVTPAELSALVRRRPGGATDGAAILV
jgi:O-antigen/teichoic acid export membrane protein